MVRSGFFYFEKKNPDHGPDHKKIRTGTDYPDQIIRTTYRTSENPDQEIRTTDRTEKSGQRTGPTYLSGPVRIFGPVRATMFLKHQAPANKAQRLRKFFREVPYFC